MAIYSIMFSLKENLNSNRSYSNSDCSSIPFHNALTEITEKASKVRSLLERKQRDDAISNLISISNNDLMSLKNIKVELINRNQQSLDKVVSTIEERLRELYLNSEKYMESNIDRNIQNCRDIVQSNSDHMVEKILSSIQIYSDKCNFHDELSTRLKEQNSFIESLFSEMIRSMNEKDNKIVRFIKEFTVEQDEKSKSIYLSQLAIIQKQYELIIRDLRKRNLLLEHNIETKLSSEEQLSNQIESMNKKITDLFIALDEKDAKIGLLNTQTEHLKKLNQQLRENNEELINKNEEILNKLMYQLKIYRKKYLFYGSGINFLNNLLKSLFYLRKKKIFEILRKCNSKDSNTDFVRNLNETENNSSEMGTKVSKLININEISLFNLLDVEKQIQEQEKEQNLINTLLSMMRGRNFNQLISFTKIVTKKRLELMKKAFNEIKIFKLDS